MELLVSEHKAMKRYTLFSRDENGKPTIHYVYKLLLIENISELTVYQDGYIDYITHIKHLLAFNIDNPIDTINTFNKLLLVQSD
jgi:hypothetical protein